MATFDAPDRETCVAKRARTNTPLQAFVLLHGPQFVEAARHLAERMMKEGGDDDSKRLAYGFQLALGRLPSERELEIVCRLLTERRKQYRVDQQAAQRVLSVGESEQAASLGLVDHAAYATVSRLLMNTSEFVTKE